MHYALSFGLKPHVLVDKRVYVGIFVDDLVDWFPCAVPGIAVYADKFRSVAGIGCLKSSRILERMSRYDSVVMICRSDKDSGIRRAVVFDVVRRGLR